MKGAIAEMWGSCLKHSACWGHVEQECHCHRGIDVDEALICRVKNDGCHAALLMAFFVHSGNA